MYSLPLHSFSRPALTRVGWAKLALLASAIAFIAGYAIFGPSGWLAVHRRRVEYKTELNRLNQLDQENRQLHQSIHALQTDPATIESIARSQLHLTRPGEVVYNYTPASTRPSTTADIHLGH